MQFSVKSACALYHGISCLYNFLIKRRYVWSILHIFARFIRHLNMLDVANTMRHIYYKKIVQDITWYNLFSLIKHTCRSDNAVRLINLYGLFVFVNFALLLNSYVYSVSGRFCTYIFYIIIDCGFSKTITE